MERHHVCSLGLCGKNDWMSLLCTGFFGLDWLVVKSVWCV